MSPRFTLIYRPESRKDYDKLDGSQKDLIDAGLRKLEIRADEIGKPLHGKLAGCRALKWQKAGLRLVYRIGAGGYVEIVEILAIGKREESEVYELASSRLRLTNNWLTDYVRARKLNEEDGSPDSSSV